MRYRKPKVEDPRVAAARAEHEARKARERAESEAFTAKIQAAYDEALARRSRGA